MTVVKKWLNLEAYGASLEMWRNAEKKFFYIAMGGTEEAHKAFMELGGKQNGFFGGRLVAFNFPPIEGEANAALWQEKLPKAFLEARAVSDFLLVRPGKDDKFPEEMKAAAVERQAFWTAKAAEMTAAALANEDDDFDFDIPGFYGDLPDAAPTAPLVGEVTNLQLVPEPAVAPVVIDVPISAVEEQTFVSVEPARAEAVAEVPQVVEVVEAAAQPASEVVSPIVEPEQAQEPVVSAPVAEVAVVAEPEQKPALEQFIRAVHEGDDRPVMIRTFRQLPTEQELAQIREDEVSGAILKAAHAGTFDLVMRSMPEDSQVAMVLVGADRDRMISNVNRMLGANPDLPLIAASWGSRKDGQERLVLVADGTIPKVARMKNIRGVTLPVSNDEQELGVFLNSVWRELYGQENEVVSIAARVPKSGNAPDAGPGAERAGVPGVRGEAELAALEGHAPAGSGVPVGAGAVVGRDAATGSGLDGGAIPGAQRDSVPAGAVDARDNGRGDAGRGTSGDQPAGNDRAISVGGNAGQRGADGRDRQRGDRNVSGVRDGQRAADDSRARGANSEAADRNSGVEEGPVGDVVLEATELTAEQTEALRAELAARTAERSRGLDLDMQETSGRLPYVPRSNLTSQGVMVPSNMETAVQQALSRVEREFGNLDEFVARQLGFEGPEDLDGRLYAEQVDSIALAFSAFSRGRDMVVGDLTGIGKGRILASMIRYGHLNDIPVVFITKDQTLYNSMAREMAVLGMSEIVDRRRMLITSASTGILNDQGEPVFKGRTASELNEIYETGVMPQGVRVVFTTHSQLMYKPDNPRVSWLRNIAQDALVLVDESHLSAGVDSNCGANIRAIAGVARHTMHSSATSAKEGKNLSLYSGTDLGVLGAPHILADILRKGGAAAMEAVPLMLAQEGQYIRREHDLSKAQYASPEVPVEHQAAIRADMDSISGALRALMNLQQAVSDQARGLNENAYIQRQRDAVERRRKAREVYGLSSQHFGSALHHFSQQALLAVHANFYADLAIETAQAGNKPVLVLQSTMETMLSEVARVLIDNDINPAGAEVEMSFGRVLRRMARRITEMNLNAGTANINFNLQDATPNIQGRNLPQQLQLLLAGWHINAHADVRACMEAFEQAVRRIPDSIPASPIDFIKSKLANAGFSMGELTGRRWEAMPVGEGVYRLDRRDDSNKRDRQMVMNRFNSGESTGIIINKAGATGIDLHADFRFEDQRVRDMIVMQADDDIYVFQQALGRVFRANMVVPPRYTLPGSAVPVAVRSMAIMRRRLSSMMSLTRGSRDSEVGSSMPDLFNWVGSEAALEYLQNNHGIADALDINLAEEERKSMEGHGDTGLAARLTALAIMLPCAVQEEMIDGLIRCYHNKLEDLDNRGINPFRSRHLDIKATVAAEVVIQPADGPSVFQGEVVLKELVFEEEMPLLTPDTVKTLISVGRQNLAMEGGASRNWSRQPVSEVMAEIAARMETRFNNLRDLFDQRNGSTIEEMAAATYDGFGPRAAREFLGLRAFAPRIKLGAHVRLHLDSDEACDFNIVGIEPPKWSSSMHDTYEWRLLLVSPDVHARQARVPVCLLLTEAFKCAKQAHEESGVDTPFAPNWDTITDPISNPAMDLIDSQGRFIESAFGIYENLERGKIEVRRHVLSGNILRAIAMASDLHKGLPSTYTLADGSREYGVVMPNSFDKIKLLEMPVKLSQPQMMQDYAVSFLDKPGKGSAKLYMGLSEVNVAGVQGKDVSNAKKDSTCDFTFHVVRRGNEYKAAITVPRAKGRSGWLVADEEISRITAGMEWQRNAGDLKLDFHMSGREFPERLVQVIERLNEMGVSFRTPYADKTARQWLHQHSIDNPYQEQEVNLVIEDPQMEVVA